MTAAPVEAKPEAPFVPPGMPQPTVDPAAYTDDAPEFSPAVKAILATPVDPELVELRRVKEGSDVELLYVPWIQYQDVLFRAFGPGGWRLVPRGPARTQGTVMTWKGALFVRAPGQTRFQFIKEADGECNLQGGRMTPGNAAEGAQSDCLTKCCKGLHIFMELFDPRWRRAWEAKYKAKHKQQERAAQWPAARAGAQGAGGGGESATSSSARAPSPAPSSSSAAAPAAGPAPSDPTDTGEAASAESKGAIASQLKAKAWKLGMIRVWFETLFGVPTASASGQQILDRLTQQQADNAYVLLISHGGPGYDRCLAELRAKGQCRPEPPAAS